MILIFGIEFNCNIYFSHTRYVQLLINYLKVIP